MRTIHINDIEALVLAKNDFKFEGSIIQFINSLNLANSAFVFNDNIIPFTIKGEYLFACCNDNDIDILKKLEEKLASIDYNLDRLESLSTIDLMDMDKDLVNFEHFVIGGKFYY